MLRGIICNPPVPAAVVSAFSISKLHSSRTYYVFDPKSKAVFLQRAKTSYGVEWANILNPFVRLSFIPNGIVEYRGNLTEIQMSVDHYNTLKSKNIEKAHEFYLGQFTIDIDNLITSSTFNYK